jgi:hypothetical protein
MNFADFPPILLTLIVGGLIFIAGLVVYLIKKNA